MCIAGQTGPAREAWTRALSLTAAKTACGGRVSTVSLAPARRWGRPTQPYGYFAAAESILGPTPETMPPDWQQEWLEIQFDRMNAPFWRAVCRR